MFGIFNSKMPSMKRSRESSSHSSYSAKKARAIIAVKKVFRRPAGAQMSLGPEVKNYDTALAVTTVSTGAPLTLDLLSGLAEGTGDTQRVGRKIKIVSIDMQLNVNQIIGSSVAANTTASEAFIDVFLCLDKSPDLSTLSATNVFISAATNLTYISPAYLDRVQTLHRWRVPLSFAGPSTACNTWHSKGPIGVAFTDATGVPQVNGLVLYALSPNAAAATTTAPPQLSAYCRVKFTDN